MSTTNKNRVSAGVPTGGQFAASVHAESVVTIKDPDPLDGMSDEEIVRMGQSALASPDFLTSLAHHDSAYYRRVAAHNPSTRDTDLGDLTRDPNQFVRAYAAANLHTPDPDLEGLLADEFPDARHNANATLRTKDGGLDESSDDRAEPVLDDGHTGQAAHQALFPDGESNRQRRGHEFLPPSLIEQLPGLYSTENVPLADKQIYAHYFNGACDWYIAELDREDGTAFGHCDLGMGFPEWGNVNLVELESLRTKAGFVVERDCYFTPTTATKLGIAS
jgi:hypothetical protein